MKHSKPAAKRSKPATSAKSAPRKQRERPLTREPPPELNDDDEILSGDEVVLRNAGRNIIGGEQAVGDAVEPLALGRAPRASASIFARGKKRRNLPKEDLRASKQQLLNEELRDLQGASRCLDRRESETRLAQRLLICLIRLFVSGRLATSYVAGVAERLGRRRGHGSAEEETQSAV